MKALLSAVSVILSTVAGPAYQAGSGVEVLTDDSNIMNTTALQDLGTDPSFDLADFPKKDSLGKDLYGNEESAWQGITMTNGVKGYKYTYFYFYHPLCDYPRWANASTGESSFDVSYRLTLSYSPELGDYSHHGITPVDHSEDLRFWKFVCTDDFSRMSSLDYQAYDISEFEMTKADGFGGSNAYKVGKRFSWEKGEDGSFLGSVQDLNSIELSVFKDYWRIPGSAPCDGLSVFSGRVAAGDGFSGASISYIDFYDYKNTNTFSKDDYFAHGTPDEYAWKYVNEVASPAGLVSGLSIKCPDEEMNFCENDLFYSVFPLSSSFGTLVGAKVSFSWRDRLNLLSQHVHNDGSDVQDNFMTIDPLGEVFLNSGSEEAYLSSGLENEPYQGLETLSFSQVSKQLSGFHKWLFQGSRPDYWIGYADTFDLPCVQKLSKEGTSWVAGQGKTFAENPYAISPSTVTFLDDNSLDLLSSYWILRYMSRSSLFFRMPQEGSLTNFYYFSLVRDVIDSDVLSLTFFKDGSFFTIGVVSDSGDVIVSSGASPATGGTGSFSWQWLLIILGLVLAFILVYSVVKYLMNRQRRR